MTSWAMLASWPSTALSIVDDILKNADERSNQECKKQRLKAEAMKIGAIKLERLAWAAWFVEVVCSVEEGGKRKRIVV